MRKIFITALLSAALLIPGAFAANAKAANEDGGSGGCVGTIVFKNGQYILCLSCSGGFTVC